MPSGLDTSVRTAHTVAGIRGPRMPSPQTLTAAPAADALADVVALPHREVRPARDGATRRGGIVPLDGQNRIAAAKLLGPLGWGAGQPLVAGCGPGRAVLRAGAADSPLLVPVPVDSDRRLTLPPTVTGALGVGPGEQVLAVAVPATGELLLRAAADVLQELTGPLPQATPAPPAAAPAPAGRGGRSRVRPRWQASG